MLDERKIEELLTTLRHALEDAQAQANHAADCARDAAVARTDLLVDHEFEGRNVEARKLETEEVLLDDNPYQEQLAVHRVAEDDHQRSKDSLEVARAAVGLWKAYAYQMSRIGEVVEP